VKAAALLSTPSLPLYRQMDHVSTLLHTLASAPQPSVILLLLLTPQAMMATAGVASDSDSKLASSWSPRALLTDAVFVLALAGCLASRRSRQQVDGDDLEEEGISSRVNRAVDRL
jgi:hypothetical protein